MRKPFVAAGAVLGVAAGVVLVSTQSFSVKAYMAAHPEEAFAPCELSVFAQIDPKLAAKVGEPLVCSKTVVTRRMIDSDNVESHLTRHLMGPRGHAWQDATWGSSWGHIGGLVSTLRYESGTPVTHRFGNLEEGQDGRDPMLMALIR